MTTAQIIIWGALGALLPDAIRFAKSRLTTEEPISFFWTARYWGGVLALLILGVVAVLLLGPQTPREAAAFGYCAPELLTRILSKPAASTSTRSLEGSAPGFNLREWWSR